MSVGDSATAGIVGAHLDGHSVARKNADVKLPHPSADGRQHDQSIVALTRNIAFGRASWTTPSNSSLSPFGSLRSRRSLIQRQDSPFTIHWPLSALNTRSLTSSTVPTPSTRREYRDLHSTEGARPSWPHTCRPAFGRRLRGRRLGARDLPLGRGVILQVVNLSSPFVGSPQYGALDEELAGTSRATTAIQR